MQSKLRLIMIVILGAFSQISECSLSQARADGFTGDPLITTYEEKGGRWLPAHGVYERIARNGTDRFRREMKWKTNQVNHAMEKSAVSIESLGAVAGDRIVDKRDGSESTFGQD